jgi:methyl-accepting chemotaxis protein
MVAQADPTTSDINEVVASTQGQLAEGRKLVEEAKRLADATEEQASMKQELAQNTERLRNEVHATIEKAEALANGERESDG